MGKKLTTPNTNYEDLRKARILQNKARLESLGLQKTISELRASVSSAKPAKTHVRKCHKKVYPSTDLRRSNRLKNVIRTEPTYSTPVNVRCRRSTRLRGKPEKSMYEESEESASSEEEEMRPANAPMVDVKGMDELSRSPEVLARRCDSKGRGSIYDPVYGICCHFCRQKKLCGEEDCKHCGNLDIDEPCIGKTDCSVCHSSNGVLCRACLKVRYGEELEKARENKEWMCPHCIEEKGIKPYWICNSSLCLKKRKIKPTGIAIFKARELGYESVCHLLMDELQRKGDGCKCR